MQRKHGLLVVESLNLFCTHSFLSKVQCNLMKLFAESMEKKFIPEYNYIKYQQKRNNILVE